MKSNLQRQWMAFVMSAILCLSSFSSGEARGLAAMLLSSGWTATNLMTNARENHTLSVLPDGSVLAAGGYSSDAGGPYLNTSEIFNPTTNSWTLAGNMISPRSEHTATVLLDGRILVAGGKNGLGTLASAEIFDPVTKQWSATESMANSRSWHTATRLIDGRVLVVGGCYTGTPPGCSISAETFDPSTEIWTEKADLPTGARQKHTAVLLQDGSVLVAGGILTVGLVNTVPATYKTAYRYYPATDTWSAVSNMVAASHGRSSHNAVLMRNGKVLVVGGRFSYVNINTIVTGDIDTTEIYDPATNLWSNLNKPLSYARELMAAVLDATGNYILLGGATSNGAGSTVEYMDINNAADSWHAIYHPSDLVVQRKSSAAAILPGGVILVAGGRDQDGVINNTAETNRFHIGDFEADINLVNDGLFDASGTMLSNGDILITGGADVYGEANHPCHHVVHRWSLRDNTVDFDSNMKQPRCGHTTTLLPDGRVVVIGGSLSTIGSSAGAGEIFSGGNWTLLSGPWLSYVETSLLPNGKILVLQPAGAPAYIFNPVDLSFRVTMGSSAGSYSAFSATLMENGKVLILGSSVSSVVEVFDPQTEVFTTINTLPGSLKLYGHTATLMPGGKVMIAGGLQRKDDNSRVPQNKVYLFNPSTGGWSTTGPMGETRFLHSAVLLPDGRPVVLGGNSESSTTFKAVEIYDPAAGTWSKAGDLFTTRYLHKTLLTLNGKLLSFGGANSANQSLDRLELFAFANISVSTKLWKPTLATATCVNCGGERRIELTGSDFTETWEGSSGGTAQSAANQPVVQLMRLDNQQTKWIAPGTASSDSHFLSAPIAGFPDGPAIVFTYVNGSFQGKVVLIAGLNHKVYLPMLRR